LLQPSLAEAALLLGVEPLNEPIALPKLYGVVVNNLFRKPPGLGLIRTNDIDSIDDMAVRPDHVGSVLGHFGGASPGEVSHLLMRDAVSVCRTRRKSSSRARRDNRRESTNRLLRRDLVLRPWQEGDDMSRVSVSAPDNEAGSPKPGDMIERNPKNHDDQWLVAAQYFADNFEPVRERSSMEVLNKGPPTEAASLRSLFRPPA
jgi:hypothetical protein